MDAVEYPLRGLALQAASRAEDLGFVALADVSRATHDLDEVLVIGGQMVTLHAYRWGLGSELLRESKDADIGMPEMLARDQGIVDRLEALGYHQRRGGEFIRLLADEPDENGDLPEAAIDVLVPARTSRPRESRRVADRLVTTEVSGLATALRRPAVQVELALTRMDGTEIPARIWLPDEVATVVLRAYAWQRRLTNTDAEDVWRSLEIAYAAGVSPSSFETDDERRGVAIIAQAFGKRKSGAREALGSRIGRVHALMSRVLGLDSAS